MTEEEVIKELKLFIHLIKIRMENHVEKFDRFTQVDMLLTVRLIYGTVNIRHNLTADRQGCSNNLKSVKEL
jgi:hypothetical protein